MEDNSNFIFINVKVGFNVYTFIVQHSMRKTKAFKTDKMLHRKTETIK